MKVTLPELNWAEATVEILIRIYTCLIGIGMGAFGIHSLTVTFELLSKLPPIAGELIAIVVLACIGVASLYGSYRAAKALIFG